MMEHLWLHTATATKSDDIFFFYKYKVQAYYPVLSHVL